LAAVIMADEDATGKPVGADHVKLRDLNCADCGRPMREIVQAIAVSGQSQPMMVHFYGDGTGRVVCRDCEPNHRA
jgi:hypothetical protein